jgi:hypothetical protein
MMQARRTLVVTPTIVDGCATLPIMRWAMLGIAWVCSFGCRVVNESHCANLEGDSTCRVRDEARPFCSACTAEHDGCVDTPVVEPECSFDGSSSTSTGATASTSSTTTLSTSGSDASSSSSAGVEPSSTSEPLPDVGTPTCGDGIAEGEEVCDGDDLAGISCETLDLTGGTLACNPDCASFDTTGCRGVAVCGNGVAEGNERCDGDDLAGATCASQPDYAAGELACNTDCELDGSACDACLEPLIPCEDDDQCCSENCGGLGVCA